MRRFCAAVVDQEQSKSLFGSLDKSQNQILDFVAEFVPYKISPKESVRLGIGWLKINF